MVIKAASVKKLNDWWSELGRIEGAYAHGTLRAYRTDITTFVAWCESSEVEPFPALPETISNFVSHEAQRCSVSTIKRRLAALGKIHRLMKFENPVSDEEVRIAFRKVLRSKLSRQHQALGMTSDLRDQLINSCDSSLSGRRNAAMISVGYDTLARRSELVAMNYEDLFCNQSGAAGILIKRSKSDPFGRGRKAYLSQRSHQALKKWLEGASITNGPLFRAVQKNKIQKSPLHPFTVNRIIKRTAQEAGLSSKIIQELSGHSMRIGAAQDMAALGIDILPIMAAGGWKTTSVVARYIENADLSSLIKRFYLTQNDFSS